MGEHIGDTAGVSVLGERLAHSVHPIPYACRRVGVEEGEQALSVAPTNCHTQPTTLLKTTFYFSYCIIFIDGIEDIENLYDLYFLDILEAIDFPDILGRALGGQKRAGEIVACSP